MTVVLLVAGGYAVFFAAVFVGTLAALRPLVRRHLTEEDPPALQEMADEMHAADAAVWDTRIPQPPATSQMYLRHAHIAHAHLTGREVRRG